MKRLMSLIITLLLAPVSIAHAGTLANGDWSPAQCGIKPNPPTIDGGSVEAFNKSVAAINSWQQQAKTYFECLINEANTDSAVIANKANTEQADYAKTVKATGAEAEAAKKKLDKR
ncbi:MAG: hypothetical protein PHR16_03700 [Methylovulum sp.]|nr:hypothetical protein [Methylovulum sp.]